MNLLPIPEHISLSSHDAAVMNSLKDKIHGILGSFDTSKRVVFFDYPLHLNVGDLLIQLGTERFFAENPRVNSRGHYDQFRQARGRLRKEVRA